MKAATALLIDFGSTFTKATAVDLQGAALIGRAAAHTTVETDVGEGLGAALRELARQTGRTGFDTRLACSSAAGGLRMVVSGLVPALTAEAAKVASLGAGAKVVKVYAHQLIDEDIAEIAALRPDIFLLAGGTDGGNRECILHNARALAGCPGGFPIIIAGNRTCAAQCERLLAGREVFRCANIMPELGKLNIEPAQQLIRELFLRRIVQAKGLSRQAGLLGGILMPTPAAVMCATELLAKGTGARAGLGELVAVDLGGATTDVYSMAGGEPAAGNTVIKGLPEPWAKRTVEGDIGMRYSAAGVLAEAGAGRLAQLMGQWPSGAGGDALPVDEAAIPGLVERVVNAPGALPDTPGQAALDFALAAAAVEIAVTRHAGTIEEVYTPAGPTWLQAGKDLTRVGTLVATGGALVHSGQAAKIAAHALHSPATPGSLRPKSARVRIDRAYILSAMGLLAAGGCEEMAGAALGIMTKELE